MTMTPQTEVAPSEGLDPHQYARARANATRYVGGERGHYESVFLRGNHPTRPLAFWIRYTIFSPAGRSQDALGELWGMYFDGETGQTTALREAWPLRECHFDREKLDVRVGGASLSDTAAEGQLGAEGGERLGWQLRYAGGQAPLYLLPQAMYEGRFPKAKTLVPRPGCRFDGTLRVGRPGTADAQVVDVDGWQGSQNHNWGSQHTSAYAWVQCAGFDGAPDAFLECAVARLKYGPLWTPAFTVLTLRIEGEELRFDSLLRSALDHGSYQFGETWDVFSFEADVRRKGLGVHVRCEAPRDRFVALTYLDPPGGERICLNSKLGRCEVRVERADHAPVSLRTEFGAAFEILADEPCGLPLKV